MPAGRRFRQITLRRDAVAERDRLLAEGLARRAWIYKRTRSRRFTLEWEPAPRGGAGGGVTLAAFAPRALERVASSVRSGTLRLYRWALELHILPELGALELRDLEADPAIVRDFLFGRLEAGLAKKTVANVRGVLASVLEDAVEEGAIARNPAAVRWRKLRLTTTRAERAAKVRALDADELRRFLAAAADVVPRWSLLFRVAAFCGLRLGEVLALQWDDVSWSSGEVEVRRGVTRGRIEPTKTGAIASVDVPAPLIEELRQARTAARSAALAAGEDLAPWIFPTKAGRPRDHNDAEAAFKRALARAGLPGHFTPHSLRHSFASLHLQRGAALQYVQRMLRHRTVTLTADLYGSHLPARTPELADALFRAVDGEDLVDQVKKRRRPRGA